MFVVYMLYVLLVFGFVVMVIGGGIVIFVLMLMLFGSVEVGCLGIVFVIFNIVC